MTTKPMRELVCIDGRTGCSRIKTTIQHVLILEMEGTQSRRAIKFFQCELTKAKNYTVPRNGDFAKLYRLTFGESPDSRFSRADRLLGHFVGKRFLCETKETIDRKTGEIYDKVIRIEPIEKQQGDEWSSTGTRLKKPRSGQNPLGKKLAKDWQKVGKSLAISWQKFGNDESLEPSKTLGLEPVFNPINTPLARKHHTNTPPPEQALNPDATHGIVFEQQAGESDDDFLDRFLDESLFGRSILA